MITLSLPAHYSKGILLSGAADLRFLMGCGSSRVEPGLVGHPDWERKLGHALEGPLQSGAIALLDAAYVVKLAKKRQAIQPRQLLPAKAFISLDEIRAQDAYAEGLRIICVSYPWLQVTAPRRACLANAPPHTATPIPARAAGQPRPKARQPRQARLCPEGLHQGRRAVGSLLGLCQPLPGVPPP